MKMNTILKSHEHEKKFKKSCKRKKTGKVMKMNKILKSHENEYNHKKFLK